ncbi:MAG: SMC-Scp complex subunit ScpB [Phycisphaeraceae bacterium]
MSESDLSNQNGAAERLPGEVEPEQAPELAESAEAPESGVSAEAAQGEPESDHAAAVPESPEPEKPAKPQRELTETELEELPRQVEAALLTADRAMPPAKLGEALGDVPTKHLSDAVDQLNAVYEETGRSFRIEKVAGGWQILTLPEYADVLSALRKTRAQSRLSPAAMETLAIVAYRQPILRAEIEAIRGVACGEVLRSLMDRHLVRIAGRAEEIGRPILYGTTKTFLETFGLSSLRDLPKAEELRPRAG